ncbi:putative MnhB-related membrane protein [Sedimentibacter acidaminivorans]|uniref:MnhB-related membrane protein n=1 Tax=Sedimentibacter acidaminivorans TaxID=913099 RepID=A0ABS4GE75_9FIRM|nr:hydrogenase subunit MbhD domain-containing protein [Sedimentibacter acidaminivorans]MBP1926000.1 putative MnhB-related membrane protein [Sedimentibacter acidaminivorans]
MKVFSIIMLIFLIFSSIAVSTMKSKLGSIIVFAVYSLIMAILWEQLEAPDLAITEAAVGAGITTVLLILTLSRIRSIKK